MAHERPENTAPSAPKQDAPRRPYVAPKLRHLGSVRDLTLGTSNKAGEGGMRNM